jgi:hypothetical protein
MATWGRRRTGVQILPKWASGARSTPAGVDTHVPVTAFINGPDSERASDGHRLDALDAAEDRA